MITFTAGGSYVQIEYPEWSFLAKAHLAMSLNSTCNGWDVWDNGIVNDYRTCEIERLHLNLISGDTTAKMLDDFLLAHRDETLEMNLPSGSGFFPFGPDKGDAGNFDVKIIERKFGQYDQFRQYTKSMILLMVTAPVYVLPDIVTQGDFQIGEIEGLLYPQLGIDSSREYGIQTGISYGGDAYSVDIRHNIHETSFIQQCNTSLAAALMNFLCSDLGRYQDISIVAPGNYYLFDMANGSDGTYTCKLIQDIVECKHVGNEQFEIPLKFWMKSAA
jgi:hypothetical protein